MAHPARLERAACGFEVRRSIQLSYGCASSADEFYNLWHMQRNFIHEQKRHDSLDAAADISVQLFLTLTYADKR
jgi:hypothetical protein